jgi:N-dimethylarginine dimethylaminohydrolase
VLTKDTHGTVIRFAPPLVIERAALDWGIDVFAETLREFEPAARPRAVTKDPTRLDDLERRQRMQQPAGAGQKPRVHLMMCAPDFFEVSYRINPWMEPERWSVSAERLAREARAGWAELKRTYERLGACVDVQPPQRGLPDMVFTANAALVLDRKAMLARFLYPERQGEQAHDRAFFEALRARGAIDAIVEPPAGLYFEGAGDAIWDRTRGVLWTGFGQRSSREMQYALAEAFAVPTVGLELIDPRFYHLDTCFCVLSRGDILWYRPALSAQAAALVEELVGRERLIEATDEDAHRLAVNSVCLGDDVVLCYASEALRAELARRGYRTHVVPLESFNRAGGAAYCLTLRLDLSTRPEARREPPFVEEDFSELRAAA